MKSKNAVPTAPREEIIRQLEQFPVEVLEAALVVLQLRERQAMPQSPSGT